MIMTDRRRLWASDGRILQAKLWESKLRGITVRRRKAQNNSLGGSQTLWFCFKLELESSLRMTRGSLASTSMTDAHSNCTPCCKDNTKQNLGFHDKVKI
jgi:hypothetical protein